MSISKILEMSKNEMSDAEKLRAISVTVSAARESYGNADAEISADYVSTADGDFEMKFLNDETKLVLVRREVKRIKIEAIEMSECRQGVNINKVVEQLVATSPVLVNISDTTEFSYL